MEYFYTPPNLISTHSLTIDGDEFAHLTHVMRKKPEDQICVVDGVGNAYDVIIEETSKRVAHCRIQSLHHRLHEPTADVTIAVGILKNHAKFDFLVEKCTELGVNTIIPLLTERTVPRHAKTDRWQKLVLAAMKQSGRCVLPVVKPLTPFGEFVKASNTSNKIIAHEKGASTQPLDYSKSPVAICIGPEGGFTEEEVSRAEENGFQRLRLGARRLRTETAAIVSTALILTSE